MSGAPRVATLAKTLTVSVVVAYLFGVTIFAFVQRKLLYFPTRRDEASEVRAMARAGFAPVRSARGDVLAYRSSIDAPEATLIVAHGNAGAASDRVYFARLAARQALRFETWLVEYPGYGSRTGEPSEASNVAAVVEAIDRAKRLGRPIVLLGESLGSAVVALAAEKRAHDVLGVILVTPLPRIELVSRHHYPLVPTSVIADRYEADRAIAHYPGPVAFVVAGHDEVIPPRFGLAMHEGHPGPKMLEVDESAAHNTVDYTPTLDRWRRVFRFVTRRGE